MMEPIQLRPASGAVHHGNEAIQKLVIRIAQIDLPAPGSIGVIVLPDPRLTPFRLEAVFPGNGTAAFQLLSGALQLLPRHILFLAAHIHKILSLF